MAAIFSVVVLTAPPPGQGTEGGGPFVKIDGREALLRSVELFLNRENVKQVQIVFTAEAMEEAKRKYAPHLSFSGVKILTGGPRWMDQIAAGHGKISAEATHVIVHDAARPAVPYSDIDALMEAAEKSEAVVLASALRSGLVEVDEGGGALAFHGVGRFMQVLTPQAYSKAAYEQMAGSKQEIHASKVSILKGSPLNVRAGGTADASIMKSMLSHLPKPKIKAPLTPFEEAQW